MNRYRMLLRPRWIAGHLVVILSVILFVNLGLWQVRRLEERRARNALIEQRIAQPSQSLDDVIAAGTAPEELAFRRVELAGVYLPDAQLLTAPRSVDGRPGQQVLTVAERDDGAAVLVDRGWVPFDRTRAAAPPVSGEPVRIAGVVRAREPGDIGGVEQVAQIVPEQIADRLGIELAPYYIQLATQQPVGPDAPPPTPLPELTEGSHLSYALQWFSFAVIAVIGYGVLLRRSLAQRPRPPDAATPGERPRRGSEVPVS